MMQFCHGPGAPLLFCFILHIMERPKLVLRKRWKLVKLLYSAHYAQDHGTFAIVHEDCSMLPTDGKQEFNFETVTIRVRGIPKPQRLSNLIHNALL